MPERKKVAVVILSWNGIHYFSQFMPSVIAHTPSNLCDIIVADNMSSDGSVSYLKDHFPSVKVIENKRNGGYAGGYNDALKFVDAEYYVLLNQDIEVTPGWIERTIHAMEADKNIAAAQPKLRAYDNKEYFEYAGASGGYLDTFGYPYCRGRVFDTIERDNGQYDDTVDVFWATGACLFIRSEVWHEVGGLDEDFFAHQEEIDLCWRLNSIGKRVVVVPEALVYHVGGGSLPQGNPRKTYLNFRNNLSMIFKNLPVAELWWKLPIRFALDNVAAIWSVKNNRNFKDCFAILKAHLSFVFSLKSLINKRREIAQKSSSKLSGFSIVWKYYVQGKKRYIDL